MALYWPQTFIMAPMAICTANIFSSVVFKWSKVSSQSSAVKPNRSALAALPANVADAVWALSPADSPGPDGPPPLRLALATPNSDSLSLSSSTRASNSLTCALESKERSNPPKLPASFSSCRLANSLFRCASSLNSSSALNLFSRSSLAFRLLPKEASTSLCCVNLRCFSASYSP